MTQIAMTANTAPQMPPMATGLERGTRVFTLKGAVPVEKLHAGDRIITRSGATVLKGLVEKARDAFALDFDRPQVILLDDGQVRSDTGLPVAA